MADAPAPAPAPPATLLGTPAPAAAAAPAAPVQGGADDPRAWLPEEFRTDPGFKDFKDVAGLAKSFKHAASMVGLDKGKVLRLPGAEDAPEWGDVFAALGRPEKPEGYGLKPPAEGVPAEAVAGFAAKAHALGLTQKQAEGVLAFYGETATGLATQAGEALAAQAKESEAALRKEFGAAYDDRLHAARKVLREDADSGLIDMLERTGLGNHPGLVKLLAKAGMASSEPADLKGGGNTQLSARLTPADAKGQIAALDGDAEFMKRFMDANHPGHAEAVDRRRKLFADAFPGGARAA